MKLEDKQYDFISKEIEIVYNQIDKQRESTTNFLKIYLSIIVGLLTYIYFLENRLLVDGKRISVPNLDFIIFGAFGVLVCFISFIIGWALLDNVTKTVYKSIKYYKHISYMRHIVALTFEEDIFRKNSIIPIRQAKIPMRISKQVPIIGGLINFALLILTYYFFRLFLQSEIAYISTCLILTSISIFYANQLEKHFEEILIADSLIPEKDEIELKKIVSKMVKLQKRKKNYKKTKIIYTILAILVLITSIISLTNLYYNYLPFKTVFNFLPGFFFMISIIPRTYMGIHRLRNIKCFE